MDPITILAIVTALSAVVSAAGSIYAGQKTQQAADYNAALQERQAEAEQLEAREAIKRRRAENEAFLSRQMAIRANSGVSIEEGSSLLAAAESAARLELEALEMSRSAQSRQEALKSRARMTRFEGSSAATASYFNAGESLLRGGAQAYGTYKGI